MSSKSLSTMDHKGDAEDMQYLTQPRGPGTGWVFRMITPPELVGRPNPWTGQAFGREIKRGLKTRYLPEARKRRDVALGEVRKLVFENTDAGRFSLESAEEWREMIQQDRSDEQVVASVLSDKLEAAASRGASEVKLRRFGRLAFGKGLPLTKAVEQYVEERKEGNKRNYKSLKTASVNDLRTAVRHLRTFLGDTEEIACLEDVSPLLAKRFRNDYLPAFKSPRSLEGLSHKTVNKIITLLAGLWAWAEERNLTRSKYRSPWVFKRSVPQEKRTDKPTRHDFSPEQVCQLLAAVAPGTREGDVLRLALVTGCRADELATLQKANVEPDGTGFQIMAGKTTNATRFVPLPTGVQELMRSRLALHPGEARLFPEWPVRASGGKASALPQWFTRFRRDILGAETDGTLTLHSMRHTWRTVARQARLAEGDIDDIGGWAGPKTSSSVYDHGLLREQLAEAQEKVWQHLHERGYLHEF